MRCHNVITHHTHDVSSRKEKRKSWEKRDMLCCLSPSGQVTNSVSTAREEPSCRSRVSLPAPQQTHGSNRSCPHACLVNTFLLKIITKRNRLQYLQTTPKSSHFIPLLLQCYSVQYVPECTADWGNCCANQFSCTGIHRPRRCLLGRGGSEHTGWGGDGASYNAFVLQKAWTEAVCRWRAPGGCYRKGIYSGLQQDVWSQVKCAYLPFANT